MYQMNLDRGKTFKETWLITNYSCNNRCKWCYTTDKNFEDYNMPLNFAKDTLRELYNNGIRKCTLIGGEPTLYPYLENLLEHGSKLGMFMKIVTNGIKLADEKYLYKLYDSGLSLVAISIHGYTRAGYKENTQTDNLHSVEKAILNCKKMNIPFVTLSTLNRLNYMNVLPIVEYLTTLGVENIIFNIAVPYSKQGKMGENILNPKEIADVISSSYMDACKKKLKFAFYASIPLCLFEPSILEEMLEDKFLIPLSQGGCNIFEATGFAIEPNGDIIPCCKRNQEIITNVCEKGAFKYKNNFGQLCEILRGKFGHGAMPYPDVSCSDCELREDCIGGCPVFWQYFDKSTYVGGK